jgi:PAS domain-containing protein
MSSSSSNAPTGIGKLGLPGTCQAVSRQGRESELSSPEELLARILERVPQPVWVVDHPGCIMFANPAACSALGYGDPAELLGKPGHDTVHYKRPDGTPYPEPECPGVAVSKSDGLTVAARIARRDVGILQSPNRLAAAELVVVIDRDELVAALTQLLPRR